MRIGIVGMGWVGSSVAVSTLHTGIATELLVHDVKTGLAEGEALDLAQGASFYPSAMVRPAAIEELAEADAVVIAAGRGGRANESRLDLMRDNLRHLKWILWIVAGSMVLYLGAYFSCDESTPQVSSRDWAAKVDGVAIPIQDYYREARGLERTYRAQLGEGLIHLLAVVGVKVGGIRAVL